MGARARGVVVRIGVVVASVAAVLVPGWSNPARAITVPTTLARSVRLAAPGPGPHGLELAFAPTHIAFEWTGDGALEYRTGSRWRAVRADPDASSGDTHFSSAIAVDRPDALQWRSHGVTDVSVDYVNTIDGPRRTVMVPALAGAAPHAPDIVTRAEWGADESVKRTTGTCARVFYPVQQLFVHHTAGVNDDPHPRATMRAIYYFHVQQRGWCDVGYNFVIAPDGTTFEGRWARRYAPWELHSSEDSRGRAVAGAHVAEFNSGSVGISMMGNFSQMAPSPAARRALAELLAWEADRHDLPPGGRHTYRNPSTGLRKKLPYIAGHRDAGQTECPGTHLYAALAAVRRDVKAVIGDGKADTQLSFAPEDEKVTYGDDVVTSGRLTEGAAGVADAEVTIYVHSSAGWSKEATVRTAADGSFSHAFSPEVSMSLRAVYDGDATRWGSQSRDVKVLVGPAVTLEARGGLVDAGGVTHYPPGTTQVELGGSVVPAHAGKTVVVHVAQVGPDGVPTQVARDAVRIGGDGSFSYLFDVPDPDAGGTFRATAWFKADRDHASNPSEPVTFVVDPRPVS